MVNDHLFHVSIVLCVPFLHGVCHKGELKLVRGPLGILLEECSRRAGAVSTGVVLNEAKGAAVVPNSVLTHRPILLEELGDQEPEFLFVGDATVDEHLLIFRKAVVLVRCRCRSCQFPEGRLPFRCRGGY